MHDMFNRGHVLRALREQHGWSQKELAHKARLHVVTVNRAEQNKANVTDDTWRALALALGQPPDWLMAAHADPMSGAGGTGVTHPVTDIGQSGAAPPPPGAPTAMPAPTPKKQTLIALITAIDEAVAAEIEPAVWRLVFRAKLKPTPEPGAPPTKE